jgi:hypothetical protein
MKLRNNVNRKYGMRGPVVGPYNATKICHPLPHPKVHPLLPIIFSYILPKYLFTVVGQWIMKEVHSRKGLFISWLVEENRVTGRGMDSNMDLPLSPASKWFFHLPTVTHNDNKGFNTAQGIQGKFMVQTIALHNVCLKL